MLNVYRKDNTFCLNKVVNILTASPISYPYFKDNFQHAIELLNASSVSVDCSSNQDDLKLVYEAYSNFAKEYMHDFIVVADGGLVKIPLPVLIMHDIRNQIATHLNFLTIATSTESKQQITAQVSLCDDYLDRLLYDKVEEFTFGNTEDEDFMKALLNEDGLLFNNVINNLIGLAEEKNVNDKVLKSSGLHLHDKSIAYRATKYKNELLAYLLFNVIFLRKRFSLFFSSDQIKGINGFSSDMTLADSDSMKMMFDAGASGTMINISYSLENLYFGLENQKELKKATEELQELYSELLISQGKKSELYTKMMDEMKTIFERFPSANFEVTGKVGAPFNIVAKVKTNNPKSFNDISRLLKTQLFVPLNEPATVREYKKTIYLS